jgi:hypothetical protein
MFMASVFTGLMLLLILAGGAALYMGVLKAAGPHVSLARKAASGIVAYAISGSVWGLLYSFHYLGW